MRKMFVIGTIVISLLGHMIWAIALPPDRGRSFSKVDKQAFRFRLDPKRTTRTEFRTVVPLELYTCNRGGVTFTFSGTFSGGPVDLRVVHGFVLPGKRLAPGVAHFDPGSVRSSFSFTWGLPSAAPKGRAFRIEWRSANGDAVTMHQGLTRVLYNDRDGCL